MRAVIFGAVVLCSAICSAADIDYLYPIDADEFVGNWYFTAKGIAKTDDPGAYMTWHLDNDEWYGQKGDELLVRATVQKVEDVGVYRVPPDHDV